VRQRPARKPGEQVVDRHVGHALARGVGGRADVGEHEEVRDAQQRVVGRERLGVGDVEGGARDLSIAEGVRERC